MKAKFNCLSCGKKIEVPLTLSLIITCECGERMRMISQEVVWENGVGFDVQKIKWRDNYDSPNH